MKNPPIFRKPKPNHHSNHWKTPIVSAHPSTSLPPLKPLTFHHQPLPTAAHYLLRIKSQTRVLVPLSKRAAVIPMLKRASNSQLSIPDQIDDSWLAGTLTISLTNDRGFSETFDDLGRAFAVASQTVDEPGTRWELEATWDNRDREFMEAIGRNIDTRSLAARFAKNLNKFPPTGPTQSEQVAPVFVCGGHWLTIDWESQDGVWDQPWWRAGRVKGEFGRAGWLGKFWITSGDDTDKPAVKCQI